MEIENHRLGGCEKRGVLGIGQTVRMRVWRDEFEQVGYVEEADFQVREVLPEEGGGGEGFVGRDVAAGCHD